MKYAPLKSSFMAISMVGFLISALYIPKIAGTTWAFTFGFLFTLMFVASMISMTHADPGLQLRK